MKITRHCARALRAALTGCALLLPCFSSASPIAMQDHGVCAKPQGTSAWQDYCDQLIASGVKWVRISPEWGSIETAKGIYDTAYLARLDNIVDYLHDHDVNIVWILCYTATWASSQPSADKPTRYKPADWADWEDYVAFIVGRYDGKITHWEAWNEPDAHFWKDSVSDYLTLLQKSYTGIKAVNSNNVVLIGGLADSHGIGSFFDQLMGLGAKNYFDIVNYHAYGDFTHHVALHQGTRDVMQKHGIPSRPIWITETGYTTNGDPALEAMKADMVDQVHYGNLCWSDIQRTFWYAYSDTPASTPADPFHENFGLTDSSLVPHKSLRHYQALDGASTDFALQAAYPTLIPMLHTLYYHPASSGDGSHVTASDDDRVIPATRYMYLKVNDDWLCDSNEGLDETVYAEVTYLDSGTGDFQLQYDATTSTYQSLACARTNTGEWKTVTFTLDNVKFANRQNQGADLRLYAGPPTSLTVRNITLCKRTNPATVILRSTPRSKLIGYHTSTDTSGEAYNPDVTMGGVPCRSITNDNQYFFFRVSDGFIRQGDTDVDIAITFWDSGTDNIGLQYDSLSGNWQTINIAKTNTNTWRTVTLHLTDANFINAANRASDFRIYNGWDTSTEYVSRVDVTVHNQAWAILKDSTEYRRLFYVVASGEADNAVATAGGVECRAIEGNNKYLYFRVNDDLAGPGDTDVDVTITFWDAGTDNLTLQYNSLTNDYQTVAITKTNTNAWRTVTLHLTDADFKNAQNKAADFRICNAYDASNEYVSRVDVAVQN